MAEFFTTLLALVLGGVVLRPFAVVDFLDLEEVGLCLPAVLLVVLALGGVELRRPAVGVVAGATVPGGGGVNVFLPELWCRSTGSLKSPSEDCSLVLFRTGASE